MSTTQKSFVGGLEEVNRNRTFSKDLEKRQKSFARTGCFTPIKPLTHLFQIVETKKQTVIHVKV